MLGTITYKTYGLASEKLAAMKEDNGDITK